MTETASTGPERFEALDVLRGTTMVVMALDHARDFFSLGFVLSAPTDLAVTNLEVFLTRWITHFAAPVFIFLAGIGLFFASGRRSKAELATLAFTRGLWLIVLELTLVGFFWSFSADFVYKPKIAVLFAIGVCMIAMAGFIFLPKWLIGLIAALLIFGHNLFDGVGAQTFGAYGWVWLLLHEQGTIAAGAFEIRVVYPFVPWIGIMALGYLVGPVTRRSRAERKHFFLLAGALTLLAGLLLRWSNLYGDPSVWSPQPDIALSIMSFLNFTKYPPSLIYLGVLIGSAMIAMALLDRPLGRWSHPLRDFGRVPFFFYVLHIPLLHLGGIVLALAVFGDAGWLMNTPVGPSPQGYAYRYELLPTYLAWIGVVVLLYYPSKRFAELKSRHKAWWMSYL